MNTKRIISTTILAIATLAVSIGISYVFADWQNPTAAAPAGNLEVPVNATVNGQAKVGYLSVNTFAALGNGALQQQVLFRGPIHAIDPNAATQTLHIGGRNASNTATETVVTTVSGSLGTTGTLGSSELINSTLNPVCADPTGHFTLTCGSVVVTPPSSPIYYASCFIADTKVTLANGSKKNIQDVKMGDVLKGDTTNNTVLGFHQPTLGDNKLYAFNGGGYFVTAEHPFMTTGGWKSIDPTKTRKENIGITVTPLKIGDVLVTAQGLVKIKTIDSKAAPASTQLYNFILDGDHTYYADGYLVHNKTAASASTPNCSTTGTLPCAIPTSADGRQLNPGTIGLSCNTSGGAPSGGWGACPINPTTSPFCGSSGIQLCQ